MKTIVKVVRSFFEIITSGKPHVRVWTGAPIGSADFKEFLESQSHRFNMKALPTAAELITIIAQQCNLAYSLPIGSRDYWMSNLDSCVLAI